VEARGKINIQSRVVAEVPQSQMSQMHARKDADAVATGRDFSSCAWVRIPWHNVRHVNEPADSNPSPKPRWPLFLLGAVVLAIVLAVLWVSVEARRVRQFRKFDYRPKVETNDPLAGFRTALTGGDVTVGRGIFFNKPEASCARCHRVGGQGGDNGPALDNVGSRLAREQLLESLVQPNASILKDYESVIVVQTNGTGVAGVLRRETETQLVIHTPDDGEVTVNKAEVVRRVAGPSPMPDNFATLVTTNDLRDLVAFLATLTNAPPRP
jgi:putative heme-binding domain-containing protein